MSSKKSNDDLIDKIIQEYINHSNDENKKINGNILITKEKIEEILQTEIDDDIIYKTAFVHKSFQGNYIEDFCPKESNERLEFLGDSFIGSIISKYLYLRYPESNEGFLSKLKIKLVKTITLSKLSKCLNFDKYILTDHLLDVKKNNNILENTFEAFIGACILERKYDITEKFLIRIFEEYIDFTKLILTNDNFKDSLMRYFKSLQWDFPKYYEIFVEKDNYSVNKNIFTVGIPIKKEYLDSLDPELQDKIFNYQQQNLSFKKNDYIYIGIDKDYKKKDAEQKAAKKALINLNVDINY
jgi:dsRNA-specific ribonuclease